MISNTNNKNNNNNLNSNNQIVTSGQAPINFIGCTFKQNVSDGKTDAQHVDDMQKCYDSQMFEETLPPHLTHLKKEPSLLNPDTPTNLEYDVVDASQYPGCPRRYLAWLKCRLFTALVEMYKFPHCAKIDPYSKARSSQSIQNYVDSQDTIVIQANRLRVYCDDAKFIIHDQNLMSILSLEGTKGTFFTLQDPCYKKFVHGRYDSDFYSSLDKQVVRELKSSQRELDEHREVVSETYSDYEEAYQEQEEQDQRYRSQKAYKQVQFSKKRSVTQPKIKKRAPLAKYEKTRQLQTTLHGKEITSYQNLKKKFVIQAKELHRHQYDMGSSGMVFAIDGVRVSPVIDRTVSYLAYPWDQPTNITLESIHKNPLPYDGYCHYRYALEICLLRDSDVHELQYPSLPRFTQGMKTSDVRKKLSMQYPEVFLKVKSAKNKGKFQYLSDYFGLGFITNSGLEYAGSHGYAAYQGHIYRTGNIGEGVHYSDMLLGSDKRYQFEKKKNAKQQQRTEQDIKKKHQERRERHDDDDDTEARQVQLDVSVNRKMIDFTTEQWNTTISPVEFYYHAVINPHKYTVPKADRTSGKYLRMPGHNNSCFGFLKYFYLNHFLVDSVTRLTPEGLIGIYSLFRGLDDQYSGLTREAQVQFCDEMGLSLVQYDFKHGMTGKELKKPRFWMGEEYRYPLNSDVMFYGGHAYLSFDTLVRRSLTYDFPQVLVSRSKQPVGGGSLMQQSDGEERKQPSECNDGEGQEDDDEVYEDDYEDDEDDEDEEDAIQQAILESGWDDFGEKLSERLSKKKGVRYEYVPKSQLTTNIDMSKNNKNNSSNKSSSSNNSDNHANTTPAPPGKATLLSTSSLSSQLNNSLTFPPLSSHGNSLSSDPSYAQHVNTLANSISSVQQVVVSPPLQLIQSTSVSIPSPNITLLQQVNTLPHQPIVTATNLVNTTVTNKANNIATVIKTAPKGRSVITYVPKVTHSAASVSNTTSTQVTTNPSVQQSSSVSNPPVNTPPGYNPNLPPSMQAGQPAQRVINNCLNMAQRGQPGLDQDRVAAHEFIDEKIEGRPYAYTGPGCGLMVLDGNVDGSTFVFDDNCASHERNYADLYHPNAGSTSTLSDGGVLLVCNRLTLYPEEELYDSIYLILLEQWTPDLVVIQSASKTSRVVQATTADNSFECGFQYEILNGLAQTLSIGNTRFVKDSVLEYSGLRALVYRSYGSKRVKPQYKISEAPECNVGGVVVNETMYHLCFAVLKTVVSAKSITAQQVISAKNTARAKVFNKPPTEMFFVVSAYEETEFQNAFEAALTNFMQDYKKIQGQIEPSLNKTYSERNKSSLISLLSKVATTLLKVDEIGGVVRDVVGADILDAARSGLSKVIQDSSVRDNIVEASKQGVSGILGGAVKLVDEAYNEDMVFGQIDARRTDTYTAPLQVENLLVKRVVCPTRQVAHSIGTMVQPVGGAHEFEIVSGIYYACNSIKDSIQSFWGKLRGFWTPPELTPAQIKRRQESEKYRQSLLQKVDGYVPLEKMISLSLGDVYNRVKTDGFYPACRFILQNWITCNCKRAAAAITTVLKNSSFKRAGEASLTTIATKCNAVKQSVKKVCTGVSTMKNELANEMLHARNVKESFARIKKISQNRRAYRTTHEPKFVGKRCVGQNGYVNEGDNHLWMVEEVSSSEIRRVIASCGISLAELGHAPDYFEQYYPECVSKGLIHKREHLGWKLPLKPNMDLSPFMVIETRSLQPPVGCAHYRRLDAYNDHVRLSGSECQDRNMSICPSLKFYSHLQRRQEISYGRALETAQQLCCCGTKSRISSKVVHDKLPVGMVFCQYSTCPVNSIGALLLRHCKTQLHPHPSMVLNFKEFVSKQIQCWEMPNIIDGVMRYKSCNQWCLTDVTRAGYMAHVRSVDPLKASAYDAAYQKAVQEHFIEEKYEFMTKTGEIFIRDYNATSQTNRPRALYPPPFSQRAVLGHLSYIMTRIAKHNCPEFLSGLELENFENVMNEFMPKERGWQTVSIDGSSHDSHQDSSLIDCVDNVYIKKFYELCFPYLELPTVLYSSVYRLATNLFNKFTCYYPGTRMPQFTFSIAGTTYSGHPLRTTLGNSVRVIMYMRYCLQGLGTCSGFYVSGDDVLLKIRKVDVRQFQRNFWLVYSDTQSGYHGLGQCAKRLDFLKEGYGNFLSRNFSSSHPLPQRNVNRMFGQSMASLKPGDYESYQQSLHPNLMHDCTRGGPSVDTYVIASSTGDVAGVDVNILRLLDTQEEQSTYALSCLQGPVGGAHYQTNIRNFKELHQLRLRYPPRCGTSQFHQPIYTRLISFTILLLLLLLLSGLSIFYQQVQLSSIPFNMEPNKKILPRKAGKRPYGRPTRRNQGQTLNSLMASVKTIQSKLEKDYGGGQRIPYSTMKNLYTESSAVADQIDSVRRLVNGRGQHGKLLKLLGLKSIEELDGSFSSASLQDQNHMLAVALGDGLWAVAAPWISTLAKQYGPSIFKKVWDWAKNTGIGKRAVNVAQDYLGLDMNDNVYDPYTLSSSAKPLQSQYFQNIAQNDSLRNHLISYSINTVNKEAIKQLFVPYMCKGSRVPRALVSQPVAFLHKRIGMTNTPSNSGAASFSFNTNATGNYILQFRPDAIFQPGVGFNGKQFIQFSNDAALSIDSGAAAAWSVGDGFCLPFVVNVSRYTVTSFSVRLNVISSALNTTGYVTAGMWTDEPDSAWWHSGAGMSDIGNTVLLNQQTAFQCSLNQASGKIITFNTISDAGFNDLFNGTAAAQNDYPGGICIVVAGAPPNSAVIEYEVNYSVEYTPVGPLLVTSSLELAVPGPATLQAAAAIRNLVPMISLQGFQEGVNFCDLMDNCDDDFESVVRTAAQHKVSVPRNGLGGSGLLAVSGASPVQKIAATISQAITPQPVMIDQFGPQSAQGQAYGAGWTGSPQQYAAETNAAIQNQANQGGQPPSYNPSTRSYGDAPYGTKLISS